jgi:mono/diheme cytochrome c family protein
MMDSFARKPRSLFALVAGALSLVVLGGCAVKHPTADVVAGKQLFVAKCASCHTLAHANANGQIGPNLDDAFSQDRVDGEKNTSIQGLVDYWIRYPNTAGVMPAKLLDGQQAQDVAAYVGAVAGKPGQDTGALAAAVANVNQKPAVEKNGTLQIDADPTGQLKSSVQHDIAIRGAGGQQTGPIVSNGGVSTINANLKPGKYTFFCTVPGHEAAGMKGTLTVK